MSDHEWETCSDPQKMCALLPDVGRDRKFRLFACACVRRAWHLLEDDSPRRAVVVAEAYADGLAARKELRKVQSLVKKLAVCLEREGRWVTAFATHAAHKAAGTVERAGNVSEYEGYACAASASFSAVLAVASAAKVGFDGIEGNDRYIQAEVYERAAQADLLREIFTNPLRPRPNIEMCWRIASVRSLAQEIYQNNCFESLPALADLLQGVGCNDAQLLQHLRGEGPHVRGCWALDLVLEKTV